MPPAIETALWGLGLLGSVIALTRSFAPRRQAAAPSDEYEAPKRRVDRLEPGDVVQPPERPPLSDRRPVGPQTAPTPIYSSSCSRLERRLWARAVARGEAPRGLSAYAAA